MCKPDCRECLSMQDALISMGCSNHWHAILHTHRVNAYLIAQCSWWLRGAGALLSIEFDQRPFPTICEPTISHLVALQVVASGLSRRWIWPATGEHTHTTGTSGTWWPAEQLVECVLHLKHPLEECCLAWRCPPGVIQQVVHLPCAGTVTAE
jgi:hypothetical protein